MSQILVNGAWKPGTYGFCDDCGYEDYLPDEESHMCKRCTPLRECAGCGEWEASLSKTVWGPYCDACIANGDPLEKCIGCGVLYDGDGMHCDACYAEGVAKGWIRKAVTA